MSWYSLRMDGVTIDSSQERHVACLIGSPSMEGLLSRLVAKVEAEIDDTRGQLPIGLRAALVAQLAVGQWASWNNFRDFEKARGSPYPPLTALLRSSHSSGSSSPERSTPPSDPDS